MALTKSDLSAIGKIVHEQLTDYHVGMAKPEFDKVNQRIDRLETRVGGVENRVGGLEKQSKSLEAKVDSNHRWLKDEINGLKGEFSLTVSRKEFVRLKAKVDRNLLPQ